MSDNNTNQSKRVEYNFELVFPQTFTLNDLYEAKEHKVKRVTLYSRIQKAIGEGKVVEAGSKDREVKTRGRKQLVYRLVDTAVPVDAGAT